MRINFYQLLIAALTLVSCESQSDQVFQNQCEELASENVNLRSELAQLKSENADLSSAKSDLEYQLSQVEHYGEDLNPGVGVPNQNSNSVSFTGSVIETTIDGEFEGWEGETIFKMMNGTIWQQASYSYTYHYTYMPRVMIYKKRGTYYMKVEDVSEEIAVRQIK
ncbi:hypothetical protein ACXYMU_09590 [Pontibacter sp. CAU 1760]